MFAREVTPALASLARQLDATAAAAGNKFAAYVILLSDDPKAEAALKELAEKEKLKKVVLAVEGATGPNKYEIAKDADVTVLLYEKKTVKKNFAFEKGKLSEADAGSVAAAAKELVPAKK